MYVTMSAVRPEPHPPLGHSGRPPPTFLCCSGNCEYPVSKECQTAGQLGCQKLSGNQGRRQRADIVPHISCWRVRAGHDSLAGQHMHFQEGTCGSDRVMCHFWNCMCYCWNCMCHTWNCTCHSWNCMCHSWNCTCPCKKRTCSCGIVTCGCGIVTCGCGIVTCGCGIVMCGYGWVKCAF